VEVFDRRLKQRQRDTMAGLDPAGEFDYVRQEVARQLVDRLEDITRSFPRALDIGAHAGQIYREICELGNPCGIEELVQLDMSKQALDRCVPDNRLKTSFVVGDEEQLPFEPESFDLVMRWELHGAWKG
jgi:NADH dehydrogenase [ubiquinone] 1 alpha subcomplex assembly factor 5